MSKWWLIYQLAAMNSIGIQQVCNAPEGTLLPGTPCCFVVLNVVRLGKKKKKETVVRLGDSCQKSL